MKTCQSITRAALAGLTGALSVSAAAPARAVAQPSAVEEAPVTSPDARTHAPSARAHLGMWTTHLRDIDGPVNRNDLLGFTWRGYYAVTFITSYRDRAWSAGIERDFVHATRGRFAATAGYRAGLIMGYDERLFELAGKTPVLPIVQPWVRAAVRPLGVELSYSIMVVSVTFSLER